jgi:hypothetical protein
MRSHDHDPGADDPGANHLRADDDSRADDPRADDPRADNSRPQTLLRPKPPCSDVHWDLRVHSVDDRVLRHNYRRT